MKKISFTNPPEEIDAHLVNLTKEYNDLRKWRFAQEVLEQARADNEIIKTEMGAENQYTKLIFSYDEEDYRELTALSSDGREVESNFDYQTLAGGWEFYLARTINVTLTEPCELLRSLGDADLAARIEKEFLDKIPKNSDNAKPKQRL